MKGHPDRPLGSAGPRSTKREAVVCMAFVFAYAVCMFWLSPSHHAGFERANSKPPSESMAPSKLRRSLENEQDKEFWIEKLLNEPRV
jgi:hypothetical protein